MKRFICENYFTYYFAYYFKYYTHNVLDLKLELDSAVVYVRVYFSGCEVMIIIFFVEKLEVGLSFNGKLSLIGIWVIKLFVILMRHVSKSLVINLTQEALTIDSFGSGFDYLTVDYTTFKDDSIIFKE